MRVLLWFALLNVILGSVNVWFAVMNRYPVAHTAAAIFCFCTASLGIYIYITKPDRH